MSRQIVITIVLFLFAWGIYTLISDPVSTIDKFETILFGLVVSVFGPQIFPSKKQATDIQTTATPEEGNPARKTPRAFWVLWATWALILIVLSFLFWTN